MSRWIALALTVGCAALPAHPQDTTLSLGKQRASASKLEWDVREAYHPKLGAIRFAYFKYLTETPVGNNKVYSRAYVSCERGQRRIAIELTNVTAPDDRAGLRPKTPPRLMCSRLPAPGSTKPVREELLSPRWEVNEIGDTMARGLTTFPLRECVSIEVAQDVELPKGWAQKSVPVKFELLPYSEALDSIFTTCGEVSAYAPGETAPVVAAAPPTPTLAVAPPPKAPEKAAAPVAAATPAPVPAPKAAPAPSPPPPPAAATQVSNSEGQWQQARASPNGKTNVRGGPNLQSPVVASLFPGMPLLAQRTGNDWWRIRVSSEGKQLEGYIREDRLVFK